MDALTTWPALVRRLRLLSSLSQCEVAQQLCVDQDTVDRWEWGTYVPDIPMQKRLCDMMRRVEPAIDKRFVEQAPAMVLVSRMHPAGFISAMSPAVAAAYQRSPTEMRDSLIYDMTSESIRGFLEALDSNPAWCHGEVIMWNAVVLRPDGNWARYTGSPIGHTGSFMAAGGVIPRPENYTDKTYQLTLKSYDEMCD